MMDLQYIQEEVTVKTEPIDNNCFDENLTESFFRDVQQNDNDLMAYLNHSNPKDKNYIKKEHFETEDGTNIFESGSHFMDPDAMIAHYEEVVQDISSTVRSADDLLLGVCSEPVRKEPKQRRSGRKKRSKAEGGSPAGKTRSFLRNIIKTEEAEDSRSRNLNFECSLCMFCTSKESDLKAHMLEHVGGPDTDTIIDESHNGDGYSCFFCDYITPSSELLQNHIKFKHIGSSPSKPTRKRNDRVNRRRSQTESEDDVEYEEDEVKVEASDLTGYMMEPSSVDALPCKLCSINTTSRSELHTHMIEFHSQKLLECSHCEFFTVYKSTLKRHEMRHSQVKMYKCKYCNFSTYNLSTFQNHELSHNELKPYPCDECDFRAKSRDSLRQHKKLHSGDMPFVCTYCSYRASKKSRIIRHERIHTGERPYACPHCSFRCNQGSTLKIHIRRHTGEKPYKCNLCSFRAVSKCSLNAHLRKHNSIKGGEFICGECEQIYNNKTALLKHEKSHLEDKEQGYSAKPVTNKRRKLDNLAETAVVNTVPEPVSSSKTSRKRQRTTTKRPRTRRNIAFKESEMKVEVDEEEEEEPEEDTTSILRLYRCSSCPHRCSKFSELTNHMSTHKGPSDEHSSSLPKKYRCTPCNMFFSRKRELKAHMKEKHEKKDRTLDFPMPDYMLNFNDEEMSNFDFQQNFYI